MSLASLTLDSISTSEPMLIRTSASHDFDTSSTGGGATKVEDDDIAQLLLPGRCHHPDDQKEEKKAEDDYSDFEIIDLVLKELASDLFLIISLLKNISDL